jgi:hypothetical protein
VQLRRFEFPKLLLVSVSYAHGLLSSRGRLILRASLIVRSELIERWNLGECCMCSTTMPSRLEVSSLVPFLTRHSDIFDTKVKPF